MDRRSVALAGVSGTQYLGPFSGEIEAFYLDIGDQAAGTIDVTITDKETGAAILTISNAAASGWYPVRVGTVSTAGAAILYAAGGTAVGSKVPIVGTIKVEWAQGTASKSSTLYAFVES